MSDDSLFYTKAKLLDKYIKISPSNIPEGILKTIIEQLRSKGKLEQYFYRSNPNPEWIPILWEEGFLSSRPKDFEKEKYYPKWHAQNLLIFFAIEYPEIVVKHVNNLNFEKHYFANGLRALEKIPLSYITNTLDKIIEKLEGKELDLDLFYPLHTIMINFANNNNVEKTFKILEFFLAPIQTEGGLKRLASWDGYISGAKYHGILDKRQFPNDLELLAKLNILKLIDTLETNIKKAPELNGEEDGFYSPKDSSGWRMSIGESNKNLDHNFIDVLINNLREALDLCFDLNEREAIRLINKYLNHGVDLFYRIALYFISIYPKLFPKKLSSLTISILPKILQDWKILHEEYEIYQNGFPFLSIKEQRRFVGELFDSPPQEYLDELGDGWENWSEPHKFEMGKTEYLIRQKSYWIGYRLWFIESNLNEEEESNYLKIKEKLGNVNFQRDFIGFSKEVKQVEYTSPLSEEELKDLPVEEIILFLDTWKPNNRISIDEPEESYSHLGKKLAKVIFSNFSKYEEKILTILKNNPLYSQGFLDYFSGNEKNLRGYWVKIVPICLELLEDEKIRTQPISRQENSWHQFRMSLTRLLDKGLANKEYSPPDSVLPGFRELFKILMDDENPDLNSDRPPENYHGSNDPLTVAINNIRPIALNSLISLSMREYKLNNPKYTSDIGPSRLSTETKQLFDKRLDVNIDPSWAVRSVFGKRLINLFWLDNNWVVENLGKIFPLGPTEEERWLLTAAASSFLIRNNYISEISELLTPMYTRVLDNFSLEYVLSGMYQPFGSLARHMIWEYIYNEEKIDFIKLPNENLFVRYFQLLNSNARKEAALICKSFLHNYQDSETYFLKIIKLWEWRVAMATEAGNPEDFDLEILEFLQLLDDAPDNFSISDVEMLIRYSIPHISHVEFNDWNWFGFQEFLADRVDNEPYLAIDLMFEVVKASDSSYWFTMRGRADEIINSAIQNPQSKDITCKLINYIGEKLGNDSFQEIYNQYC